MQEVLVFGRGILYEQKKAHIEKHYIVRGFLDNRADESKGKSENIPVYRPEEVMSSLKDDMRIILMSYQYVSMWKQLRGLGVRKEQVIFGVMFPPLTDSDELLFADEGSLLADDTGVVYYESRHKKIIADSHGMLQETVKEKLREQYREKFPIIHAISEMEPKPVSTKYGLERGKTIDRYYIESFLEKNRAYIHGDCIEIAENTYTLRYGENRVKNAYILHVEGWGEGAIKGNLETGEGISENQYDCAIITQTLMFLFDIRKAAENIYKMLKEGGTALITVAGISQVSRYDAELWGSYYSFHEDAVKALFEPVFGREGVTVETYGNVKTSMAMLCGLCQEDLQKADFNFQDNDYPVIITALLHKRTGRIM